MMQDQEILKIANKAANNFRPVLSEDEIESCIIYALWRALSKYDPDRGGCKFTTYFYHGVFMECRGRADFICKSPPQKVHNNIPYEFNEYDRIDLLDELSIYSDGDIIYDKFYKNLTLREIAQNRGVSREAIRKKIKNGLEILRSRMLERV